ncbi:unnamed protein product [Allacma fusca]|uniref:Sodium-coupled monocarboxylate transporter 1 n=1 Tax=Allacma fusca TaxID=39272 RepID=A0A8J2Q2F0_9HEXA|nr:unnamed protein product [Allacma fusca]
MLDINHFGAWDYVVVGATLLLSLLIGVYYAVVGNKTNEDLLTGERKMNVFAISASMLVTYLSAITVLGYPAEIYANGIQIFTSTLLSFIFVPLSCYMFISVFYGMQLTSVYEYLELRFDTMMVRWCASVSFILQGLVITGVVLYAPSIALERILGLPIWASIVGIGICGTVYTSIGGLKAVVWTDVFQFFMIIVGMISIVAKGLISSGGIYETFRFASEHGRLDLLDFTVDPFMRHNTLNFVLGSGFSMLCLYGTHQPQVQRYCSLPSFRHAMKAVFLSIVLKVFTMSLVLVTGISIFATYVGCDPLLLGQIKKYDQIVPHFVVAELSYLPGIMGLFVSCVFSAVLSSVSSSLNSLSAVVWEDFLSHMKLFRTMSPRGQANTTRCLALIFGAITMGLAFVAQNMGAIYQAAITAVGAISGPLGAVFLMALFIPCVNKWGATAGMVTGLSTMIFMSIQSFLMEKPYHAPLPTYIDNCPPETNFSLITQKTDIFGNSTVLQEIEWPEKLYTLSYVLYPFVGGLITTVVGTVVSLLTGGWTDAKKLDKKYLHPILQKCLCCPIKEQPIRKPTYVHADRISGVYDFNPHASNPNLFYNLKYEAVPTKPEGGV